MTQTRNGALSVGSGSGAQRWNVEHEHQVELLTRSAIAAEVAAERGYETIGRPTNTDGRTRERLRRLGIPSWATAENYYFPGLLIPVWGPNGRIVSHQYKPRFPVPNRDGKKMKYASQSGRPAALDVHPRWTADRGHTDPALWPVINDASIPLYITEGVKKADSMTSRGLCTVALAGVFNWRSTHGTLGDWEEVILAGREVTIVFDADANTNPNVLRAMQRLGRWLKTKRVAQVRYLITPDNVHGVPTKGSDDFFAAGGTVAELLAAATPAPPEIVSTDDTFSDARMAETIADEVMAERYAWNRSLGWLGYTEGQWDDVSDAQIIEAARQYALDQFGEAVEGLRRKTTPGSVVEGWRATLSAGRIKAVIGLTRGIVEVEHDTFDADPNLFGCRDSVLELDTGKARPTVPGDRLTRTAGAAFDPEARSGLWETFLARILPDADVRAFVQRLLGYSMLGVVREHVMPIFTGEGANGKGTLRDAVIAAFGAYAQEVDPEILMSGHNPRHLTFLMELRGRRLVFCSETDRGRRFAESTMKRLVGGDPIQANRMHKDPITFLPSHTLIMTTNHLPAVSGNDPAVWRRILVVPFDVVIPESERDPHLSEKLREATVQAAILAWCYRGYQEYERIGLAPPAEVTRRTDAYRHESDLVGRFLDERVVAARGVHVTAKELYEAYETWTRSEGEDAVTKTEFGKEMTKRGHEAVKSGGWIYRGLALVVGEEPPEEQRYR